MKVKVDYSHEVEVHRSRLVRALFSEAASLNPTYFGKRATVNAPTANAGWPA